MIITKGRTKKYYIFIKYISITVLEMLDQSSCNKQTNSKHGQNKKQIKRKQVTLSQIHATRKLDEWHSTTKPKKFKFVLFLKTITPGVENSRSNQIGSVFILKYSA